MTEGVPSGIKAASIAKQFIIATHGAMSVAYFKIDEVKINGAPNKYEVTCRISPSPSNEIVYILSINVDNEEVTVKRSFKKDEQSTE